MIEGILAFFLLLLLDTPWLLYQTMASQSMFETIQGGKGLQTRLWPAVVVYISLAYLLLQQKSVSQAFMNGVAVYAIYDFTNLSLFKDYSISFAVVDSLWGGVLFSTAYFIMKKVGFLSS